MLFLFFCWLSWCLLSLETASDILCVFSGVHTAALCSSTQPKPSAQQHFTWKNLTVITKDGNVGQTGNHLEREALASVLCAQVKCVLCRNTSGGSVQREGFQCSGVGM